MPLRSSVGAFFRSGERADRVFLSGGTAQLIGLAEQLATQLEVPFELLNPLRGLQQAEELDSAFFEKIPTSLTVAVSLATRRAGE